MLTFKIEKQEIIRTDQNFIVEKSRNFLTAAFVFSTEWQGQPKTVVFKHKNKAYLKLLDFSNETLVPAEIIKAPGFSVGVLGGDLITTNTSYIKIHQSVSVDGEPAPADPTPDIYSQILKSLNTKADSLRYQNGKLQLTAQGVPIGEAIKIEVGGGSIAEELYIKDFKAVEWNDENSKKELVIPLDEHQLGYDVAVIETTRENQNSLENAVCQTRQLPNGNITVFSDEIFNGRIILKGV